MPYIATRHHSLQETFRVGKVIAEHLEKAGRAALRHSGIGDPRRVFDAFLTFTLHLLQTLRVGEVTTENMAACQELDSEFGLPADNPDFWNPIRQAMAAYLRYTNTAYGDVLGQVYMAMELGDEGAGQFFTPGSVCEMMARVLLQDVGPADVFRRLREALKAYHDFHDAGEVARLSNHMALGLLAARSDDLAQENFWKEKIGPRLLPLIGSWYRPITIADPCVGSGGLLLHAAGQFPCWMTRSGLVYFHGIDISRRCTLMAKVNMEAYGITNFEIETRNALVLEDQDEADEMMGQRLLESIAQSRTDIHEADIIAMPAWGNRPREVEAA